MEQPEMQSLAAGGPNSLASNVGIPQGENKKQLLKLQELFQIPYRLPLQVLTQD